MIMLSLSFLLLMTLSLLILIQSLLSLSFIFSNSSPVNSPFVYLLLRISGGASTNKLLLPATPCDQLDEIYSRCFKIFHANII